MSLTLTMLISIYSRKDGRVQMRIFFWISFKNSSNIFLDVFFSQFTFSSILALSKVFFFLLLFLLLSHLYKAITSLQLFQHKALANQSIYFFKWSYKFHRLYPQALLQVRLVQSTFRQL